ncbi:hypothetical protein IX51_09770 [uncultured archaeon]|nr:hypothetical protein IX51_09770 [uncultured archaeon]
MVLYLSNEDVQKAVGIDDLVKNVRTALMDYGLKRAQNSRRHTLSLEGGIFRNMMAVIPALEVVGLKEGMWKSSEKEGRTKDVERNTELVCLYSLKEEKLLSIIKSHRLNELRTAAGSAIATELLSRNNSTTLGIIGTGPHAFAHLEVLQRIKPFKSYRVYSRKPENRKAFINKAQTMFDSVESVNCNSAEEVLEYSDVIVEATYSRDPVIKGDFIQDGTHINSIGSSFGGKQVLDDTLLRKMSRMVVDFKEQSLYDNSGDIIGPVSKNIIAYPDIDELGQLVAGVREARISNDEVTVYKSLGMGLFDVAAAFSVYASAIKEGIGREI